MQVQCTFNFKYINMKMSMGIFTEDYSHEEIVFGGGCFWCTEAVFKLIKGVVSVEPGYAGGREEDSVYEEGMPDNAGHAEVVKITYDPKIISLDDLLAVFFASHDPTTLDRQGGDIGEEYRSMILYTTKEQERKVKDFITKINRSSLHGKTIVTQVSKLEIFHEAEEHHRDYYRKNPEEAYCQAVIKPKLEKVQKEFANLLKKHA